MSEDLFINAPKNLPRAAKPLKPLPLLIATHNEGKRAEWANLLSDLPFEIHTLREYAAVPVAPEQGETFAANALMKAHFYYQHFSQQYYQDTALLVLADDSGLEVESLNHAPGIFSARYGKPHFTDAERAQYLLKQLAAKESIQAQESIKELKTDKESAKDFVKEESAKEEFANQALTQRAARFVCVVAVVGNFFIDNNSPRPRQSFTSQSLARQSSVKQTFIERTFTGTLRGSISGEARGTHGFGYDPIFIPENYQQTFGELASSVKNRISHRARAARLAKGYLESILV